jgi:hypothetical protein
MDANNYIEADASQQSLHAVDGLPLTPKPVDDVLLTAADGLVMYAARTGLRTP